MKQYALTKREVPFVKRFEEKYGPGSFGKFLELYSDPLLTKADMGRFFGFSKERVRQIIAFLALDQKRQQIKRACIFGYGKTWRTIKKNRFIDYLRVWGNTVTKMNGRHNHGYIKLNDRLVVRLVAVQISEWQQGKYLNRMLRYAPQGKDTSDYTAFLIRDRSECLVVPTNLLPNRKKHNGSSISYPQKKHNKWYGYLNRFDLLN